MRPRPFVALGLIALAALLFFGWSATRPSAASTPVVETVAPSAVPTAPTTIVVDVEGSVARPGVYRLPAGARVGDALAAAGGLLPEADPAALNRAAPLRDGIRVYAAARGEQPPAGAYATDAERLVNINAATAQELETLPGIGPATAEKIVRSREKTSFRSVDELQTRGLVSARVLGDIRDLVALK